MGGKGSGRSKHTQGQHQPRPLLRGEHHPPGAPPETHQGGGVEEAAVAALTLGAEGLLAHGTDRIRPVGYLQRKAVEAIEIALVISAASSELAADRQAKQEGEQFGGFPLGAIAAGLGGVGHPRTAETWSLGDAICAP